MDRKRIAVKWIAFAVLLLWGPQVWAQTFTYASTPKAQFDPNHGTAGTLTISYNFTGKTTLNSMCQPNVLHTPIVAVQVYNAGTAKSYHYVSGSGVAPCTDMNQTLSFIIDLGLDGCSLDLFVSGTCSLSERDDGVWCSATGAFFATFIKNWQFESATTASQVVTPTPPYFLAPYCAGESDPPDWFGPFGSDEFGTGLWVSTNTMIRTQIFGKSFTGVPWKAIYPVGPAGEYAAGSPKPICTQYDHGCRWGAAYCTN